MKKVSLKNHKLLAIWAADCAEHVLPYFEKKHPKDKRPQKAIKTLKNWIKTGVFHMKDIRRASLDSHAAARKTKDNLACFAARSAGQAVATAHVPEHAFGASYYALKLTRASKKNINKEFNWQLNHLPTNLKKEWKDWHSKHLPKDLKKEWNAWLAKNSKSLNNLTI